MSRAPVAVPLQSTYSVRTYIRIGNGWDFGEVLTLPSRVQYHLVDSCSLWTLCAALLRQTNSRLERASMIKSSRRLCGPRC